LSSWLLVLPLLVRTCTWRVLCTAVTSAWAASAKVRIRLVVRLLLLLLLPSTFPCARPMLSQHSWQFTTSIHVDVIVILLDVAAGTADYNAVVDGVQLVEVTSGSRWYDSSTSGNTVGVGQPYGQPYGYTSGSSSSTSAAEEEDTTSFQVIPSGQLVNLNGKLVHVGPLPTGVPLAGSSSSSGTGDGTGLTAAQQAALDALQRQAQQQGTYIPDQTAAATGSSSSSSVDPSLPPPTMSGQQAALDVLQQQAQQQGTYIPGQDPTATAAAGSNAAAGSFDLPPLSQPVASGSAGGAAARFAGKPPKEGLLLTTVLLMLPKVCGNVLYAGACVCLSSCIVPSAQPS
jgi:hypothetical protein